MTIQLQRIEGTPMAQRLTIRSQWRCSGRAHCQPVTEHPQRNAAADDRQCQAIHLAQGCPLTQSNLLRMPRRALADTHMPALAADPQFQP